MFTFFVVVFHPTSGKCSRLIIKLFIFLFCFECNFFPLVFLFQHLPQVSRFFTPAVSCPVCRYANDHTFRFCQNCGYVRKSCVRITPTDPAFDLDAIDSRICSLQSTVLSSAYFKQKQSLTKELENFLYALPGRKSVFSATPWDLCRFLVFKDSSGKTQVHVHGYPHLGRRGSADCSCPRRLSYNTVDSYIGKLRSIFNEVGRQGEWNRALLIGNPASDSRIKQYLKSITEEQLKARVSPKQVTPLFVDKLALLSNFLEKRILSPSLTPSELFVVARDQAFFKTLFFSGNRGGDLGEIKTVEIARFPGDDGFLFNHVWGKTLRNGSSNLFGLRRHPNYLICPVRAIENYIIVSRNIGIELRHGYLFRPTSPQGSVLDKPLSHSTAESRLKLYLKQAGIDEGETLHSFRSGCALTLAFSGSPLADIMSHVGWQSSATASYYLKLADVLRAGAPADALTSVSLPAVESPKVYSDYNHLKDFVLAFPSPSRLPPKHAVSSTPSV